MSDHELSPVELRRAFGSFATGIAIIATYGEEAAPVGMTVNSLSSVSLTPPLLSFCPARTGAAAALYASMRCFSVNILRERDRALSERFARGGQNNKWEGVRFSRGRCDVPLLDRALAAFECEVVSRFEAGDHLIVVGRVLALRCEDVNEAGQTVDEADEPLVFFRSRYRRLVPAEEGATDYGHTALGWGI